ncbi:MAG TPA: hypothetical protein PLL64_09685 [Rhodothermales bacterium]|nr:hypothetical protein [Rhodothermales bacterium]HRR10350.1 hypothetical protein [Rhodothermales bacterium]
MLYAGVRTSDSMGDGFITAASQTFANAAGKIVVEDEGINHSEQRHHPRVFEEIRRVMESRGRYGRTFDVAPR